MKDRIHELGRLAAYLANRVNAAKQDAEVNNYPDNIIERLAAVEVTMHGLPNELVSIGRDITIKEKKP